MLKTEDPPIDTSIVVATCGRAGMLRDALQSLLKEAASLGKSAELVVVDDGSMDETPQLLAEIQRDAQIPVIVLAGTRSGVGAARNLGARHASGTWLASFDDDQIALPGWLSALRQRAEESNAVCVGGALELALPAGHTLAELGPRVRLVLGEHLPSAAPTKNASQPASNNVLVRRDVFWSLGGYDVSFTEGAEDADLFQRMSEAGHAMWFEPAARALHIIPESRLKRDNLRWTSLRIGAGDARRFARRGRFALLKTALFRAAVLALRDLPKLIKAKLSKEHLLEDNALCSVWYTQGLVRALPAFLASTPRGSAFLRTMDFRARNGERRETTSDSK